MSNFLFEVSLYEPGKIVIVPNAMHADYAALVMHVRELPEYKWTNSYGIRGWICPANQPTLEWLENHYVEGVHYSCAEQAKLALTKEKLERTIQVGKASKRWQYLFEGTKSDFPIASPKFTPFDHQRVAVESMINMPHFALLMEMGTGKTGCICWEMLHYIEHLKDDEEFRALIICPKSLREVWRRELHNIIPDFYFFETRILDSGIKAAEEIVDLVRHESQIKIGIISYDAYRNIKPFIKAFMPNYVVLDESHYIKSPKTQRTKNAWDLGVFVEQLDAKKRILTGTPIGNMIGDLWAQFEFLRQGILGSTTYRGFLKQFAEVTSVGDWMQVEGYKNVDRLRELMARNSFVVRKDQCLDLPDKMYEIRYVDMPASMHKVYMEYANTLKVEVGGHELKTEFLIAQLIKLSQMCSGFLRIPKQEEKDFVFDGDSIFKFRETTEMLTLPIEGGDAKRKAMIDEAEDVVKEGKLIIWCRFIYDIEAIQFDLQMRGIKCVVFHGSVKDADRQAAVDRFNNDDECRVFIGQQRAGGVGLTLLGNQDNYYHRCKTAFFYSNSYSYMDRSQAEDRCHRIGQNDKVTYVDWVYSNTIDEVIVDCLQGKKDLADMIKNVDDISHVLLGNNEDTSES